MTSPDVYSNNLRFFVPRSALTEMEIIGRDIGWSGQADVTTRCPSARQLNQRAPDWSICRNQSPGKEITVRIQANKRSGAFTRRHPGNAALGINTGSINVVER